MTSEGTRLAELFTLWIGIYGVLSVLVLFLVVFSLRRHGQRNSIKHGLLSPVTWPWPVRGMVSLFVMLFAVVPLIVITAGFIFGPFLAAVEGWGVIIGVEYMLSVAMVLPQPLTQATPTTSGGKFMDVLLSIWLALIGACAMGFTAQTVLITKLADLMPTSHWGFVRFVFLYVPIFILIFAVTAGGMLAAFEDWSFSDGFYYMAGEAAGVQVVDLPLRTVRGAVIEAIFNMVSIGVIGAIIGLVVNHPFPIGMVNNMEGIPPPQPPIEEMDLTELMKVHKEHQDNIKNEQEELDKVQKAIKHFNSHEGHYPAGEYKVIIRGTLVTATESIHSATVAELKLGTLVRVLEVRDLPADHRVRGRIQEPAGWISIRQTEECYSWVVPTNIPSAAKAAAVPAPPSHGSHTQASSPPSKAFDLHHSDDWAGQLHKQVKESQISSKHAVDVVGKDGTSFRITWEGDRPILDPVPGQDHFPLKIEASTPHPPSTAFNLHLSDDWADQLHKQVKESQISSKHAVDIVGKDGTSFRMTWEGDRPILDPVPGQDHFPLKIEASTPHPPSTAFNLHHSDDWADQLHKQVKESQISSKHAVDIVGKDGTSFRMTWEGDRPILDPVPGQDHFPLKIEASTPHPLMERIQSRNAELEARIKQLESAISPVPASSGMLGGKTAVITGAGAGIGRAIALTYMKEGANLVLVAGIRTDLEDVARECAKLGPPDRVKMFPTDLSKPKGVDDLADYLLENSNGCDVLVNNAGETSYGHTVGGGEDCDEMLYLNLNGVIRLSRRLTPSMVERKSGVIINMGSIAVVDGVDDTIAVFTAFKDGLRGWSDSMHTRLKHENIRVVLVNPAYVAAGDNNVVDAIQPEEVAEICLLPFKLPSSVVPSEVTLNLTTGSLEEGHVYVSHV